MDITKNDIAVFLPSISAAYPAWIKKPLNKHRANPPKFLKDMDDLNFLDKSSPLYTYRSALYSAGHAELNLSKAAFKEPMIHSRNKKNTFMVFDSGGFQAIKSTGNFETLRVNWRDPMLKDHVRDLLLEWFKSVQGPNDFCITLDIPIWTVLKGGEKQEHSFFSTPQDCLDMTVQNMKYFDSEADNIRFINTLHGHTYDFLIHWYDSVKNFNTKGWAFAGDAKLNLYWQLKLLLKMKAAGDLNKGRGDIIHYLAMGSAHAATAFTQIQRSVRTWNKTFKVTFDNSTSFSQTGISAPLTIAPIFRDIKKQITSKEVTYIRNASKQAVGKQISAQLTKEMRMLARKALSKADYKKFIEVVFKTVTKEQERILDTLHKNRKIIETYNKRHDVRFCDLCIGTGKKRWDTLSYVIAMNINTYQQVTNIQLANEYVDRAMGIYNLKQSVSTEALDIASAEYQNGELDIPFENAAKCNSVIKQALEHDDLKVIEANKEFLEGYLK